MLAWGQNRGDNWKGGSVLVHVGTNNVESEGTTAIVRKYMNLVRTLKQTRVEQVILSGILLVIGRRGHRYRNCWGRQKKNELNIMVEDTDPHIIGITESWANTDITDAELGLTRYVMFRRDRIGRRGGGVILYVKESIQAYEIKLEREADYDEAVWCKIVSGNSKLTI